MIALSQQTVAAYERRMAGAGVPEAERRSFLRWVRFYLDFCRKYEHPPREEQSIVPFLAKLAAKGQSQEQMEQAGEAVHLLLRRKMKKKEGMEAEGSGQGKQTAESPELKGSGLGEGPSARDKLAKGNAGPPEWPKRLDGKKVPDGEHGVSWEKEYREIEGAIKLRNYSPKTYGVYRMWVQKFQSFTRSKQPGELDGEDVKRFLTELAVRHGVAASTQNQAFNALLFFYRHVLQREFGKLDGVVRAKRRPYVPVVLSRREVDAVLAEVGPPYKLVTLLLYGCGLRLAECLELRVQCFNLDAGLLTIHDGKGQKDRTVPLPENILPEIRAQMEVVRKTLRADLEAGFAGTFLPRQLEKKLKNAAKEFIWQWFFPAATLTKVGGDKRRYHLHDSHVQAAVKRAAETAGVAKRVSPHTFRHTFASHLLMAGYDLPTIQRLLGHGDVKTTMIYVQTVPTMKLKEVKSPLDLICS